MKFYTYIKFVAVSLLTCNAAFVHAHPWELEKAMNMPDWLHLSVSHRTRYESLDGQYRASINGLPGNGGDQALVFRTLIHARADLNYLTLGAEIQDSRIELADSGTATSSNKLTTTIANPLELLQAYIEVPLDNLLVEGSHSVIRGGRITMDVGSRRLVARNRFRNTINGFTGLDWQWYLTDKTFRAFYTLPVQRRIAGNILNNHARFDSEDSAVRFWGLYYSQPVFSTAVKGEAFLFGLNENDSKDRATKNRDLYTFGFRLWRAPSVNQFDYQLETVYQLGKSRISTKSTTSLNHWAYFHHAELGYSFNVPGTPRLIAQFDYASGDDNPNDSQNNRFDTLYGARRFDFGPTSTYGAFARSNLISPGLRLKLKPLSSLKTMFVVRGFWRESTADSWTTAGINGSQSYIGTQLEARLRWQVLPENLSVEGGVVHLFAGDLMTQAGKGDSTFVYTQMTISL